MNTLDPLSDSIDAALDFGSDLHRHASRLFRDGKYAEALDHAQRSYDRMTAVLPLLADLCEDHAVKHGYGMVKIEPMADQTFKASIRDEGEWRGVASGPFTELLKALVGAGYSCARLEEKFIVPLPKGGARIYVFLDRLDRDEDLATA